MCIRDRHRAGSPTRRFGNRDTARSRIHRSTSGMSTRYIAVRINGDGTESIIDPELPLSGVSYTRVLNGATEISGTISPKYAYMYDEFGVPLPVSYTHLTLPP